MKICDCFRLWSGYRVYSMMGNNSVGLLPKNTILVTERKILYFLKNPESTTLGLVTLFIPVNVYLNRIVASSNACY